MPTFERCSSKPDQAEAALLRAVLGPTPLRLVSRGYRSSRRRAMLKRSLIVATLVGSACGSALMMRADGPTPVAEARRALPADFDPVTTGSIAVTSKGERVK
jgi:hypothetical protein